MAKVFCEITEAKQASLFKTKSGCIKNLKNLTLWDGYLFAIYKR